MASDSSKFSLQTLSLNVSPLKPTINLLKFFLLVKLVNDSFVKVFPVKLLRYMVVHFSEKYPLSVILRTVFIN